MTAERKPFRKTWKKTILILTAVAAVIAAGCGIWYYLGHHSSEPVYVYPFEYVGFFDCAFTLQKATLIRRAIIEIVKFFFIV